MKKQGRIASAASLCCIVLSFPLHAEEEKKIAAESSLVELPGDIDLSMAVDIFDIDVASEAASDEMSISDAVNKPLRLTLGHEASVKTSANHGLVNNRSSIRLEYSKFFLESFFAQFDTKLNAYWSNDHRAEAKDKKVQTETITPEAFLQYSEPNGSTSIKLGVQRMIWGESEGGAITDVVSPRNSSEMFLTRLEESRIGQFMLNVDQFSSSGDWSFFFIPNPKFNKYPKEGTAYYSDPFAGNAYIQTANDPSEHEYGLRWKRYFGRSDISLMAASLMDNDYLYRLDAINPTGKMMISRLKQRFRLAGGTFNYAEGKFLIKGEVAFKSPKGFNDAAYQIIKKDVIDFSLGLTYSLGKADTIGLELVNSHVSNWGDQIVSSPRNSSSLILNGNFFFLHETLTVNWLTHYTRPYTSYLSSLRTSYKWTDDTTFSVDLHYINVPDKRNALYPVRDMSQIVFRVQYQF